MSKKKKFPQKIIFSSEKPDISALTFHAFLLIYSDQFSIWVHFYSFNHLPLNPDMRTGDAILLKKQNVVELQVPNSVLL